MSFQPDDVPELPQSLEETQRLFAQVVAMAIDEQTDEALYRAFSQIYFSHRIAHNTVCAITKVLASDEIDSFTFAISNRPGLVASAAYFTEMCSLALDAQARLLEFLPDHPRSG